MKKYCLSLLVFLPVSTAWAAPTYTEYATPPMPTPLEVVSDPLELVAIKVGEKSCADHTGIGVAKYVKKSREPHETIMGSITVRESKPKIKRKLVFKNGSPAHLTVESFKENCVFKGNWNNDSKNTKKSESSDVVIEQLIKRINDLEKRVEMLEGK